MDDEAVVPGAAADDQTELKQCTPLLLLLSVHATTFYEAFNMSALSLSK